MFRIELKNIKKHLIKKLFALTYLFYNHKFNKVHKLKTENSTENKLGLLYKLWNLFLYTKYIFTYVNNPLPAIKKERHHKLISLITFYDFIHRFFLLIRSHSHLKHFNFTFILFSWIIIFYIQNAVSLILYP